MEQPRSPFGRSAVPWDPASSHSDSRQFKFDGVRISGDEARLSKWAGPWGGCPVNQPATRKPRPPRACPQSHHNEATGLGHTSGEEKRMT